jgi:organic hydroperoxide reductase OsmC/OhrA
MMGTLAAVLSRKSIRTHKEVYRADVSGDIEDVDGILKITKINVRYHLTAPGDKEQEAREAFESYLASCPAAQSVIGCIAIQHQLDFAAA